MNPSQPEGAAPLSEHQSQIRAYVDAAAENAPGPIVIPPSAEQVDVAVRNIKSRISWASLHWGTEHVHPDAWPHIARAALGPVLADLEKSSSASRSPHTGFDAKREQILDTVAEAFGVPREVLTGQPAVDVDALQSLAQEASPGLWEVNEGDDEITLDKGSALTRWNEAGTVGYPARSWRTTDRIVEIDPEDYTEDEVEAVVADLQYIAAARPEVMLALIERLRRAEAQVTDAVAAERARAAAHAREGYRASENCDDIEKRILSGEPAIDEGDQQ